MQELVFGHRYRATEKIGAGGMADVYRAVDEVLGRTVAVKVMHASLAADPSFAARFRQEAQAAANLISPYIVNMYDWGQDGDTHYIAMEYVRGNDLKSIIEQHGALASRDAAKIGAQVCSALCVAHGYDVIHRDIKPHNIMVQPDGSAKVMDFGIARAGNTMMTQTGTVLGTAHYVSPEQAQGRPLTAASDLYSLGVVLYEAATGHVPFDADTPVGVALKQVNEPATPPHELKPDVDTGLEAVIFKAMQKNPADRYVSADDFRRDLLAVAQGRSPDTTAIIAPVVAGAAFAASQPDATKRLPSVDKTAVIAPVDLTKPDDSENGTARGDTARRSLLPWVALAAVLVLSGFGIFWSAGLFNRPATSPPETPTATVAPRPAATAPVAVPDLRSMTNTEAQTALRAAGFTVGAVSDAFSDSVDAGVVISQSPKPQAAAKPGTAIDLLLSKGPDGQSVPDIIGMTEGDAVAALEAAGFGAQPAQAEYNSDAAAGTVFAQAPAADERAEPGSVVIYTVSGGADPSTVPDAKDKWNRGKSKDRGDD